MLLQRIGILAIILIVVVFEAAIVSVMKDNARGNKKQFHKWLIIWAAVNSAIIVIGFFLATGTFLGVKL
jgi:heme/copper-type cytochrome/quinol oxidase subunit 2